MYFYSSKTSNSLLSLVDNKQYLDSHIMHFRENNTITIYTMECTSRWEKSPLLYIQAPIYGAYRYQWSQEYLYMCTLQCASEIVNYRKVRGLKYKPLLMQCTMYVHLVSREMNLKIGTLLQSTNYTLHCPLVEGYQLQFCSKSQPVHAQGTQ